MSGTVAKHVSRGDSVHMVVCTLGVRDPQDNMRFLREKEAYEAARILGAKPHILDYPVLKLNRPSQDFEVVLKKVIDDINPDRVYAHNPFDYHQVHESLSEITTKVTMNIKKLFYFEVVSSSMPDFRPNAFVDITDFIHLKVRSIQAHLTQADRIYIRSEVIKSLAHTRYIMSKMGPKSNGLAEAFIVGRFILEELPRGNV